MESVAKLEQKICALATTSRQADEVARSTSPSRHTRCLEEAINRVQQGEYDPQARRRPSAHQLGSTDKRDVVHLRCVTHTGALLHELRDTPEDGEPMKSAHANLLLFRGTAARQKATFLVDTGASGTFISQAAVKRWGLTPYDAQEVLRVHVADGTPYSSRQVVQLPVRLQNYADILELHILDIDMGVDVILGTPWLREINKGRPQIDFIDMTLQF